MAGSRFLEFLTRSKESLRKVEFTFSMGSSQNWHALFNAIPNVNEVHFNHFENPLEIYANLTLQTGSSITLPNLKTLVICEAEDMIWPAYLYDLILSRATMCPITKVVLEILPEVIPSFKIGPFGLLRREAGRLGYVLEVIDENGCILDVQSLVDGGSEESSSDEEQVHGSDESGDD